MDMYPSLFATCGFVIAVSYLFLFLVQYCATAILLVSGIFIPLLLISSVIALVVLKNKILDNEFYQQTFDRSDSDF